MTARLKGRPVRLRISERLVAVRVMGRGLFESERHQIAAAVAPLVDEVAAESRADVPEQVAGLLAEAREDLAPRAKAKDVLGWLDDAVKAMGGAR